MRLDRLWRVRTADQSATEVTFRSDDQLYLGEDALVAIHGDEPRASAATRNRAEVTLEEGSLFARAARPEAPVVIATPAAKVAVRSRQARVAHVRAKRSSTLAVYRGEGSEITAEGQTVPVPTGFGTRVPEGRAPEAPEPLAPAPAWTERGGLIMFSGSAGAVAELRWRFADSSTVALLERSNLVDGAERALQTNRVIGAEARLDGLTAGAYQLRLRAVDRREIPGVLGPARAFAVLEPPTSEGATLPWKDGAYQLAGSATVQLSAPEGFSLALDRGGFEGSTAAPVLAVPVVGPGRSTVLVRLLDTHRRVYARGKIVFEVPLPDLAAGVRSPRGRIPKIKRGFDVFPTFDLRGGAQLGLDGPDRTIEPSALLFVGLTLALDQWISIDVGVIGGWTRETLAGASLSPSAPLETFPIELRGALAFETGFLRPEVGGSGGIRLLAGPPAGVDGLQPAWHVFGGFIFPLGPGDLGLELAYGKHSTPLGDLGGPALYLRYRFGEHPGARPDALR